MSRLLQFVRNIWRWTVPESLRYRSHVMAQACLSVVRVQVSGFNEFIETIFSGLSFRWPGRGNLRVVGLFSASHGIARGAGLTCRALDYLGAPYIRIDASSLVHGPQEAHLLKGRAMGWIIQMNPPELAGIVRNGGARAMLGPRYGYWAWELPCAPEAWRPGEKQLNEIWATSTYTADAFRAFSKPVRAMPHPIVADDYDHVTPAPRRAPFTAIAFFDFNSSVARKNPLGAIRAFEQAFGEDPAVCLTIKTQNGHLFPDMVAALRRESRENIGIVDEVWPHERVLSEIKAADVLLSLHRAEGFGLIMAEAMALGTPVIATAWSGNLDFMDATSALLIPFAMVAVDDAQGFYQGQSWADPDIDQAAASLRRLRAEPGLGQDLARAAARAVRTRLSPEVWFSHFPASLRRRILRSARRKDPFPMSGPKSGQ